MPNHTSNLLELDGPQNEISRFIDENKNDEQELTFEASLPTPSETLGDSQVRNGVMPDWYEWRISNWGTKWDCYDVGEWNDNHIHYYTAWSPATAYFLTVSLQYPDVTFTHKFADEGGAFVGYESIREGEIVAALDLDWNSDEGKDLRDELGYYHPEDEEEYIND